MDKTSVTLLQKVMAKEKNPPIYESANILGERLHTMEVSAYNIKVSGNGMTKKEAKQAAAHEMLLELAKRGYALPPPYGTTELPPANRCRSRTSVTRLRYFCDKYNLTGLRFEAGDAVGPVDNKQYVMKVYLGCHERQAMAATLKKAKQRAADIMLKFVTETFEAQLQLEAAAAESAGAAAASIPAQASTAQPVEPVVGPSKLLETQSPVPSAGCSGRRTTVATGAAQASSHSSERTAVPWPGRQFRRVLVLSDEKKERVVRVLDLERLRHERSPERVIDVVAAVMGVKVQYSKQPRMPDGLIQDWIQLHGASTELAFSGCSRAAVATEAIAHIRDTLADVPRR